VGNIFLKYVNWKACRSVAKPLQVRKFSVTKRLAADIGWRLACF
jgi:hypothetical protein